MFGYILACLIGGVLLVLLVASLSRARPAGQDRPEGHAVQRDKPAADEPTPDRSATAPEGAVRAAKRRIPPA
ncbi:MAG TPA: hypothetical protein VEB66_01300 [Opitutaceae bacterium]|nr:hypothetical protein [Opitutaceae bacterium]